jgi:hypothetical protein
MKVKNQFVVSIHVLDLGEKMQFLLVAPNGAVLECLDNVDDIPAVLQETIDNGKSVHTSD